MTIGANGAAGRWREALRPRAPAGSLERRTVGAEHYRIGPWRGAPDIGYLAPGPGSERPTAATLQALAAEMHDRGYRVVHTAAVGEDETGPYLAAGFRLGERLHLLRHDLGPTPGPPRPRHHLRRARRSDVDPVLDLDRRAFDRFWALDLLSLREATRATPHARFRVGVDGDAVTGYAITGRAGGSGYLQRLAVDPRWHGRGIATGLVLDGLDWLRRRGCSHAMVNTQERNERALALYEHLGFRRQARGLVILSHGPATP